MICLGSGMAALVAKQVFFALVQSFCESRPPTRRPPPALPLQLKGNALNLEIRKLNSM